MRVSAESVLGLFLFEKDASLKGEFIRMVLGSELSQEQKAEVIRCGILALSGEEI